MEILHLDPGGRGDTTLIDVPDAPGMVLLDCASEASAKRLDDYVRGTGRTVVHAIVSHFDLDHFTGVTRYLAGHAAIKVMTPVSDEDVTRISAGYSFEYRDRWQAMDAGKAKKAIQALQHAGHTVAVANSFGLGNNVKMYLISALNKDAAITKESEENGNSLRWIIEAGTDQFRYYTAGDAEEESLKNDVKKTINVMKLSHHGARTKNSNNPTFLASTGAKAAIVLGPGGMHGHPDPDVLEDARQCNIRTYATGHYSKALPSSLAQNHIVAGTDRCMGDICLTLFENGTYQLAWFSENNTLIIHEWTLNATAPTARVCQPKSSEQYSFWQWRMYWMSVHLAKLSEVSTQIKDIAYREENYDCDNSRDRAKVAQPPRVVTCSLCNATDGLRKCENCKQLFCEACMDSIEDHLDICS